MQHGAEASAGCAFCQKKKCIRNPNDHIYMCKIRQCPLDTYILEIPIDKYVQGAELNP